MAEMSDDDYAALERFIKTIIHNVANRTMAEVDGVAAIMHPLTAWDRGNQQEFIPWVRSWLQDSDNA